MSLIISMAIAFTIFTPFVIGKVRHSSPLMFARIRMHELIARRFA